MRLLRMARRLVGRTLRRRERFEHWLSVLRLQRRAHRRDETDLFQPPETRSYRQIFVGGCPRSGTTWIRTILANHPSVVSTRESHAFERIFEPVTEQGCARLSPWEAMLWRDHRQRETASDVGLRYYVPRDVLLGLVERAMHRCRQDPGVSDEDAAGGVIRQIFDYYFLHAATNGETALVEKTPGNILHGDHVLRTFPEARLIEVLRDGRDVCTSLEMRAKVVDWPQSERRDQIATWIQYARRGNELHADPEFAPRIHRVRYEDMKGRPTEMIAELFSFAGLEYDDAMLAEIAKRTDFRNLTRPTGPEYHNRKGIVGDWRDHFTHEDEALFREMVGDLFAECGYSYD